MSKRSRSVKDEEKNRNQIRRTMPDLGDPRYGPLSTIAEFVPDARRILFGEPFDGIYQLIKPIGFNRVKEFETIFVLNFFPLKPKVRDIRQLWTKKYGEHNRIEIPKKVGIIETHQETEGPIQVFTSYVFVKAMWFYITLVKPLLDICITYTPQFLPCLEQIAEFLQKLCNVVENQGYVCITEQGEQFLTAKVQAMFGIYCGVLHMVKEVATPVERLNKYNKFIEEGSDSKSIAALLFFHNRIGNLVGTTGGFYEYFNTILSNNEIDYGKFNKISLYSEIHDLIEHSWPC